MNQQPRFIQPGWPAPGNIQAFVTTRHGGFSQPPYQGFNLGDHVGDEAGSVVRNRQLLVKSLDLPAEPRWLDQVHGATVVNADEISSVVQADASYTDRNKVVCIVMTADCLPVFFASADGREVAVAHAGWRGLSATVLESTIKRFSAPANQIVCWLGPAIGAEKFEVGSEVRDEFVQWQRAAESAFKLRHNGQWLADIYQLARLRLLAAGVDQVYGGEYCTCSDSEQFFSYRRDHNTGRMASLIWKR